MLPASAKAVNSTEKQSHESSLGAQCNLQALIESSALSHLDPDLQWSLRMLLPRGRRLTAKIQPVLCTAGPVQPAAGELAPAAQPAPLVQPAQAQSDHMLAVLAALLSAQAPAPQVRCAPLI